MAKKKVNLAYIAKDSVRKATFKKRKKGLLKKVSDLSILCGVSACTVIFGEKDILPDTWPGTAPEVRHVLDIYNDLPEADQTKKTLNLESFLRERIAKLRDQQNKMSKSNIEFELWQKLVDGMANGEVLHGAGLEEAHDLGCMVEAKFAMVLARCELLRPQGEAVSLPAERRNEDRGAAMDQMGGRAQFGLDDFVNSIMGYPQDWPDIDPTQWNDPRSRG